MKGDGTSVTHKGQYSTCIRLPVGSEMIVFLRSKLQVRLPGEILGFFGLLGKHVRLKNTRTRVWGGAVETVAGRGRSQAHMQTDMGMV